MRNIAPQWTLQGTLVEDLQKLLCLEKSFMMTLPTLAQNATDRELQKEFERLCCQTREQIDRLHLLISPEGSTEIIHAEDRYGKHEDAEPWVRDGMLIAETRDKQHAKIALYSTVCLWAHQLGLQEMEAILTQNLQEEETNCQKLLGMAHKITRPTA